MILEKLAEEYQQLYIKPEKGKSKSEEYLQIIKKGKDAPIKSLTHFKGNEEDSLVWEKTPEGKVRVLTLAERTDFERFLQIMLYRCEPKEISPSIGAMTLNGLVNWKKINRHKEEFLKRHPFFLWGEEFKTFTSNPENYKETLILLSRGAYSGLSSEAVGLSEEEWMEKSQIIRRCHEVTHVICRRRYPNRKDAVWDEIVADCIGLLAAFGTYDVFLAGKFLGVSPQGYTEGRLINYLPENEKKGKELQIRSIEVFQKMQEIERLTKGLHWKYPYDIIDVIMDKK